MMFVATLSNWVTPFLFLSRLAQCSFYDNPEVELPPEGGTPLDELKAKWDSEVSLQVWSRISWLKGQ